MSRSRLGRKLFDGCRNVGVIGTAVALVIVSGCHKSKDEGATKQPEAAGNEGKGPSKLHAASPGVVAFFNANFANVPSVADIAGYNDEQRLPGLGNTDYGDITRLYVAPRAPTAADLTNGAIVGLIEVQGDANGGTQLPAYQMLDIDNVGNNTTALYCVFLKSTGHPANPYDGFVTPVANGTTCTPIADNYKLSVAVDQTDQQSVYVARFIEDAQEKPAIGVGCPMGSPARFGLCHLGRGIGSDKQALADEQEIAIPAGTPHQVMRSGITGRVTPEMQYPVITTAPSKVATINLSANPPAGSRYRSWGLVQGDNSVWVFNNGQNHYSVQFVPGGGSNPPTTQTAFDGHWTNHAGQPTVPNGARWVWDDSDEDLWVACDQGCCMVNGAVDQGNKGGRGHNQ
jgi:hypothetical protein